MLLSVSSWLILVTLATIALCVGAIYILRRTQGSITSRLVAGAFAGMGGWLLAATVLDGRGAWPLIVLAILLAITGGARHDDVRFSR